MTATDHSISSSLHIVSCHVMSSHVKHVIFIYVRLSWDLGVASKRILSFFLVSICLF
jgi:hypothetical protein